MIQINIPMWLRVSLYLAGAVALQVGKYLVSKDVFGQPELTLCNDLGSGALVLATAHAVTRSGGKTTVEPLPTSTTVPAVLDTTAEPAAAATLTLPVSADNPVPAPTPAKKPAVKKTTAPAQKKDA